MHYENFRTPHIFTRTPDSVGVSQPSDSREWITYSNPLEEFTVRFPKRSDNIYSASPGFSEDIKRAKNWSRTYFSHTDRTYLFAFGGKNPDHLPIPRLLLFAKNHKVTEKQVVIDGYQGKEVFFEDDEGYVHRFIVIQTKIRTYLFHSISLYSESKASQYFLGSIRLSQDAGVASPLKKLELEDLVKRKRKIVRSRLPIRIGSGGIGNGADAGHTSKNSPILVFSKPKPIYTKLAKDYFITGVVLLRLSFTEEKKIETIAPLKRLPFGLTKASIEAAHKIKFRPAYENGKPVSVTKRVRYRFEILEISDRE